MPTRSRTEYSTAIVGRVLSPTESGRVPRQDGCCPNWVQPVDAKGDGAVAGGLGGGGQRWQYAGKSNEDEGQEAHGKFRSWTRGGC